MSLGARYRAAERRRLRGANAGIRAARGRYLFFLDPDDSLSPETLENVSKFFESCPEEVELATYPIVSIRDGKRQRLTTVTMCCERRASTI